MAPRLRTILSIWTPSLFVTHAAAVLSLTRSYRGSDFLDGFEFRDTAYYNSLGYADGDPTGGFVDYQSASAAASQGLARVVTATNQVYLGVDNTTVLSTSAQGRASVRLESKDTFGTGMLVVADIAHMPANVCGVWPSFWSYNFAEDPVAEIDIIEGGGEAGLQAQNAVSLHTCGACEFTNIGGADERSECNMGGGGEWCVDGDDVNWGGCGSTGNEQSYGTAFNAAGGGVYATYLQSDRLRIWSWPRASVPADLTAGTPDLESWGTPSSDFQTANGGCDVGAYFTDQTIIINTDFCGSNIDADTWTGETSCSNAASTCAAFVAENPAAFEEVYWLFNSIDLYQA